MSDIHQKHFDAVAEELSRKVVKPGVWARAMAEAGTDDARAQAIYIRLRVAELQAAENPQNTPLKPESDIGKPRLPGSLKLVVWLTGLTGSLALVSSIISLSSSFDDALVSLVTGFFSLLVIAGILTRSRFVRSVVLVFAYLGIIAYGLAAILPLFLMPSLEAVFIAGVALLPIGISATIIWCLNTAPALKHFGIASQIDSKSTSVHNKQTST